MEGNFGHIQKPTPAWNIESEVKAKIPRSDTVQKPVLKKKVNKVVKKKTPRKAPVKSPKKKAPSVRKEHLPWS